MNTFWEERYMEEGRIWGETPSMSVEYTIGLFKSAGVQEVLIPGSGYGRNAGAFSRAGFAVTGIGISETAVSLARQSSPRVRYHYGSVLDMSFDDSVYDGIYCFNVLHLLRKTERAAFLNHCQEQLKEGGVVFFVVFSDNEPSYGYRQDGRGEHLREQTRAGGPLLFQEGPYLGVQ